MASANARRLKAPSCKNHNQRGKTLFRGHLKTGTRVSGIVKCIAESPYGRSEIRLIIERELGSMMGEEVYATPELRMKDGEFAVDYVVVEEGVYRVATLTKSDENMLQVELYIEEGMEVAVTRRVCPKCGVEVCSPDKFCWYCGHQLQ